MKGREDGKKQREKEGDNEGGKTMIEPSKEMWREGDSEGQRGKAKH